MPSSKTGSEYWIDGSHRETALEDFYVVGPELGRYRLPGGSAGAGGGQEPTLHGSVSRWGQGLAWWGEGGRDAGREGGMKGDGGMDEEGWIRGGMEGDSVLTCKLGLGICCDAAAVVSGALTEGLQDGAQVPRARGAVRF